MAKILYWDIPGISDIESVTISEGHNSPTAIATITAGATSKDIGDEITIDLGYDTDHSLVFTGYVKTVDRNIPQDIYQIVAHDILIRAADFFIVSSTPESPFKRNNITSENLVHDLLDLAGLTLNVGDDDYVTPTLFTMGINTDIEINLISCYDICKQLADIVTWNLWADHHTNLYYMNRKPYVMTGLSGQPGDIADEAINEAAPLLNSDILDYTYKVSEKNLRNKVIVYGCTGITAEASSGDSYDPRTDSSYPILPGGFYKSIVAGLPYIDTVGEAQDSANYNLYLYNRLTESVSISIEGNPDFHARSVIKIDDTVSDISGYWYIYSIEHNLSSGGYLMNMELSR